MKNKIFEKKEFYLYKKHEDISFEEFIENIPKEFNGIIFKTIDRDAVGNSGGHPRWGNVYYYENGNLQYKGVAIYKEPDYDAPDGAYAEKMWSILGKLVLPNCKHPNIDIINDKRYSGIPGMLSYSIVDTEKEDMTDIRTILRYNGIDREDMRKKDDRLFIEELLEYIKNFVDNEENYKKLEEDVIETILLDCVTNSLDRHPDNWALVCNNETGEYKLGLYDNTVTFINMIEPRPGVVVNGNWGNTFIKVKTKENAITSQGNEVVKYIHDKYPEYFKKFFESLNNNLDKFYEIIGENTYRDVIKELNNKRSYLRGLDKDDARGF